MAQEFDPKAENEKYNIKQTAQEAKMGNADPVLNPKQPSWPGQTAPVPIQARANWPKIS